MSPEEYRRMAAVEDAMWYYRALHRHVWRALAARVGVKAAVLDAGCGTGGLLRFLGAAQPGWRLQGLDLSPLACELARARGAAEIVQGPAESLPFADESFDAVVSCDVLCQVDRPAAALNEIRRVLRPGGAAVLTMPAYAWLFSYHDRQVGNRRRSTLGEMRTWLHEAGLPPAAGTYWNMLPLPLAVVRRKIFPPRGPASDVRLYPAPLEAMFGGMMALEQMWLAAGGTLPAGSSVLAVGLKPARA